MTNASPTPGVATRVPLIVDLDGTLVATDTLWELLVAFLKADPLGIFGLVRWIFAGKAAFKKKIAGAIHLDIEALPYRLDCLEWLRAERKTGRKIWLATGSDSSVATAVAAHLGLFEGVISSDGTTNATGIRKAELIAQALGTDSYEYAGNAMIDMAIWRRSLAVIVVAPDRGVISALKRQNIAIAQHFPAPRVNLQVWLRAVRMHQWVKNLLVFTPILTSHRILDWVACAHAALGFAIFCLVASSTYLVNDLFDLSADRRHAAKCKRPLAAGLISIPSAIRLIALLLAIAAGLSLFLPWPAAALAFGYSAATLLYSAVLKKLLIADVVALALFYTARLIYGGFVTGIEISIWTLAFCAFSFFSLAAAKRINDLAKAALRPSEPLRNRAYQSQDLNALVALAAATANIAVLVLILYINSQSGEKLYRHSQVLWTMCIPLLYWFSRILTLANRGSLADDPIIFASKDRATYGVLAIMLVIAIAAT